MSAAWTIPAERPIWVAGHTGLAGSAVVRALHRVGHRAVLLRTRQDLDLLDQAAVDRFVSAERPWGVVLAAAQVGGILANSREGYDFLIRNLRISGNVIDAALRHGVERLVNLGSSCIYPRDCPQPMREEHLLTGPLEPTNEPYALAKIAAVKLVEQANRQHGRRWLSLMPTNLYGPNDTYHPTRSHVLPGLIRRFVEAVEAGHAPVTVWGSGTPRREFLHADDLAAAILLALDRVDPVRVPGALLNVGSGEECTIRALAGLVQAATGHQGPLAWDAERPDGAPRKLMDSSRIRAQGWAPAIDLRSGIPAAVAAYRSERAAGVCRG
jgi:GDP-L-fucose synthase